MRAAVAYNDGGVVFRVVHVVHADMGQPLWPHHLCGIELCIYTGRLS
jgi:hypothetical protein